MVLSVCTPVIEVDVGKAGNEKLELLLVEDGDKFCGNNVVESCKVALVEILLLMFAKLTLEELLHLLLYASQEPILYHQPNILVLVLLGNGNIPSVGNQIDNLLNAKLVADNTKSLGNHVVNIVFENPAQRTVVVQVNCFHVLESDRLAENTLFMLA